MSMPEPSPARSAFAVSHIAGSYPAERTRTALLKVPEITLYFWIVKVLTTAMGESTSDYLVYHMNPYLAVMLGAVGLAAALGLQLLAPRYVAWIYWLAVLMVAVFGTMAADAMHIQLGVPYVASTALFAIALVVVFAAWHAHEHALSIHSITTPTRELFYWLTVMTTFALGTATGDLTAITAGLGFLASGVLFAAAMVVPAVAYGRGWMNAVAAFWFAYILTRPLGASIADWLGKARSVRGLGLGDGPVSLAFALLMVGFVGYLSVTRVDVRADAEPSDTSAAYG